jgi:hypothetical protein
LTFLPLVRIEMISGPLSANNTGAEVVIRGVRNGPNHARYLRSPAAERC